MIMIMMMIIFTHQIFFHLFIQLPPCNFSKIRSIEELKFWSWPELLSGIKQCQEMVPCSTSLRILQKVLDSLVSRLTFGNGSSPSCASTSSFDSFGVRSSIDSKSTKVSRSIWWFEDLVTLLTLNSFKIFVNSMVLQRLDHGKICRFIIYYQKSRFIYANSDEKREIVEVVVDSLRLIDQSSISCKILFGILRVSQNLNLEKSCKNSLECMIGSQLDQATLDNLLVPSPNGLSSLYDVNLVLRFAKSFLTKKGGHQIPISRLKKVAMLMDSYIVEVAPDPCLKPLKFLALLKALPDFARDSYDRIYNAIDIYLQVHMGLSDEEKISICQGLNHDKLSLETCNNLSQNERFPSRFSTLALTAQDLELKDLLRVATKEKPVTISPHNSKTCEWKDGHGEKGCEQVVLHAEKLDLVNENEKMRTHLQSMQWRVVKLEKDCREIQVQMSKIMKSRLCGKSSARPLPRFCS